jgi:heme oxygenase
VSHFRDFLREHTRNQHRLLDSHPLMQRFTSPDICVDTYVPLLQALGGALQVIEPAVLAYQAVGLDRVGPVFRPRLGALESDLHALGAPLGPPATCGMVVSSVPQLAGVIYVLEGARLGGQILAARVRHSTSPHMPCHFFTGDSADNHLHWRDFLAWAEAAVRLEEIGLASEGATGAFACFLASFDQQAQAQHAPS